MIKTYETNIRHTLWPDASEKEWNSWIWQMQNRITSLKDAEEKLQLTEDECAAWKNVSPDYCSITPCYTTLFRSLCSAENAQTTIAQNEWNDPIRRHVIPVPQEIKPVTSLVKADPLEEDTHMPVPGLIQRYPDRAVVLTGTMCAAYCRHCNRRRSWNGAARFFPFHSYKKIAEYVRETPAICEVILSGGDPCLMGDARLVQTIELFHSIPHVESVRIGTRVPVVLPMRVTDEMCAAIRAFSKIWVLTQFNHPDEITEDAATACQKLREAGIPINNQAVLLKGINDTADIQRSLSRALQKIRVRPYYLFCCDRVAGTEHFWTKPDKGTKIMKQLYGTIGGLYIPRYVEDTPKGKIPRMP